MAERRTGEPLLNRYFPAADNETREKARAAFRDYAALLFRIGARLTAEDQVSVDSTETLGRRTIRPTPDV